MSDKFDVVVIGAGPAGYVAAIRAAQLGLRTACVDEWIGAGEGASFGGTCLNVGCIPSKALLDTSEQYYKVTHSFAAHGIEVNDASLNVAKMLERKDKIVSTLTGGIAMLFKANGIEAIHGHGRILAGKRVEVSSPGTDEVVRTLDADHIVIASGSEPIPLPSAPFDDRMIVDNAGALDFKEVPKRLAIIGAGVIGLELGSVWRRLGSEVVLLEAMDTFLGTAEREVSREAAKQFKIQGLDIRLGAFVQSAKTIDDEVHVVYKLNGVEETIIVDRLVVAIGRRAFTVGLLGADSGVELDDRGRVQTDHNWRTTAPDIYAVGDVAAGPMLAHKGAEEGIAVAELIARGHGHVNYETIPWVIYTHPEIAWVGKTSDELEAEGRSIKTGSFPFAATGRARAMEEAMGFVKIIADADTDRILGVHMVGPHVSELIQEAVVAMEYGASSEDLARTCHAHPTLSEAVHEAALAVDKRAIHRAN